MPGIQTLLELLSPTFFFGSLHLFACKVGERLRQCPTNVAQSGLNLLSSCSLSAGVPGIRREPSFCPHMGQLSCLRAVSPCKRENLQHWLPHTLALGAEACAQVYLVWCGFCFCPHCTKASDARVMWKALGFNCSN